MKIKYLIFYQAWTDIYGSEVWFGHCEIERSEPIQSELDLRGIESHITLSEENQKHVRRAKKVTIMNVLRV